MSLNVVPIMPAALKDDPVAFLRALADDMEQGLTPVYRRAVLVALCEGDDWKLWSFGAHMRGSYETLGLLQMGQVLVTDQILEK